MTIRYANGWWGIYGAHPHHVPKFKEFATAVKYAKAAYGLEVPRIETFEYQTLFPNRAHIRAPRELLSNTFDLFVGADYTSEHDTLAGAITDAHKLAATTR